MKDIVFPEDNEEEFIKIAEELGYKEIIFVYDISKFRKNNFQTKLNIKYCIRINDLKELQKARRLSDMVFISVQDNARAVFESSSLHVYNLERNNAMDFMHHRNSGLNQVLCKLAKEKNHIICFNFTNIDARLMGRIMQNIKLCRKYKLKTLIASFSTHPYQMRNPKDVKALFDVLGMHEKDADDALN